MSITKIQNRKIHYLYFIDKEYCAGIVLTGSEVKAIKNHNINISQGYCLFEKNELFLKNVDISSSNNIIYENKDKKLLLTKKELKHIRKWLEIKGNAVIPNYIAIPNKGFIKIHICLCKGKHEYDKRETIKQKDLERELNGKI